MRSRRGQIHYPDGDGFAVEHVAPRILSCWRKQILGDLSPGVAVHGLVEALPDSGGDGYIVSQHLGHLAG